MARARNHRRSTMVRTKQKANSKAKSMPRNAKNSASKRAQKSKKQTCLDLLTRSKGASIAELQTVTGWQAHSVRGFLSGTVKKMAAIRLETLTPEGAPRRYHVIALAKGA